MKSKEDLFNAIPKGAHFVSDLDFSEIYIKPIDMDTKVVSTYTGEVVHFSKVIGDSVRCIDRDGNTTYIELDANRDTDRDTDETRYNCNNIGDMAAMIDTARKEILFEFDNAGTDPEADCCICKALGHLSSAVAEFKLAAIKQTKNT